MDNKKTVIIIFLVLAVVVISFPTFFFMSEDLFGREETESVGGQIDEYGCLTPAGYSWDTDLKVCLRSWEISSSSDRFAVKTVIDLIGSFPGLTAVGVEEIGCVGCRMVFLERGSVRVGLLVKEGKVEDRILSPLECVQREGVVRSVSPGVICDLGEYVVGAVADGDEMKYCCHERQPVQ